MRSVGAANSVKMPSDARHSGGLSGSALDEVTSHAAGAAVAVTNQRARGARVEAGKVCNEAAGSRLEERLSALEAERRRIEGFMEVLPHCRQLLDKEIEAMREKIEEKRLSKTNGKSSLLESHMDSSRRPPIEPEESVVPSIGGAVWDDSSTSGDAGIGVNSVHLSPVQGERDCPDLFKKRRTEQPMHDDAQDETERCKARFPLSNCMEKPLGMLTLACDSQLVDGNDKFDNLQASEKHDRRHGCRSEGKASTEDGDNGKPSWLWRGIPREQHLVDQNAGKEHNEKGHTEGYHHGVRQSWLHEPAEQKDELGSVRCQHHQPHLPPLTNIKGGNENHSMQTAGNDNGFLQPGRERPGGAFLPFVPNRDNKASTGVGTDKGASAIQTGSLPACIELVLGLAPGTVPEPRHRRMQTETFNGRENKEHAELEMMQVDRTQRLLTAESAPTEDRLEMMTMTVAGNNQKKDEDMVVAHEPSREGSKGRTMNGEGGDANGTEGADSGGSESSDNSGGRESDGTNTAVQALPDAMRTGHGTMLTTTFNGSSGGGHRKARRCWSPELHRRFVDALTILGGPQVATPKQIRELMKVEGLTNDEVKSHLQKYRLHTRRPSPPQNIPLPHPPQVFVLGSFYLPPDYGSTATLAQQPPIVAATTPAGVYDTAAVAAAAAAAAAAAGGGTATGGFGTAVASLAAAGMSQQCSHFGLQASSLQPQAGLSTQPSQMLHQHQFFPCKPAHGLTATAVGQGSPCRSSQRESPQHPPSPPEIGNQVETESTPLSMAVGLGSTRQAPEQDTAAEQHLRPSCEDRTVELCGEERRKYVRDVNGGAHTGPAEGVDLRTAGSFDGVSRKRSHEMVNAHGRKEGEPSPRHLKLQLNEDQINGAGYRVISGLASHRNLYCTQPVLSQSG